MHVRALWNERIDENLKVVAPLGNGHRSSSASEVWQRRTVACDARAEQHERERKKLSWRTGSSP
jgi:hypothetical protein